MSLPFIRFLGPTASILGLLALGYFGVTKGFDFSVFDEAIVAVEETGGAPTNTSLAGVEKTPDRLRIASFNIKVFGESKSSDRNVMQVLAKIFTRFDLVAVQEIRSPHARPVDKLVELINASGHRYEATLSRSLGRTSQTEQYAYVWDTRRIQLRPQSEYVVEDSADLMHREPFVASFQTTLIDQSRGEPFSFTLINVHTDPDEVKGDGPDNELNVLDDVFLSVREFEYAVHGEDDVILLGDLNADGEKLYELGAIPGLDSVVGPYPTNTAGTKTYDHILLDRSTTQEFTGQAGVVDFVAHLGLTPDQAKAVSDHCPIWAEFSMYEGAATTTVAAASTTPPR
ncbi:MAG: endonuclease/exonuclease/phosphatase family protein [Pirellulaceae bacterium]